MKQEYNWYFINTSSSTYPLRTDTSIINQNLQYILNIDITVISSNLTHYIPVKPFDDNVIVGAHWFRYWLIGWQHKDITWAGDDLLLIGPLRTNSKDYRNQDIKIFIHKNVFDYAVYKLAAIKFRSQWINQKLKLVRNMGQIHNSFAK